ncbi:MAG: hypothetical protein Q8P41_16990 [Pseudomonadota bacterium]|nr:hypothetical protein [Pseudomonadota bacterium]
MTMLLLLSIGCVNLDDHGWAGGGARYASGYASDLSDTGTDTGGAGGDGAPVLFEGTAEYTLNDVGQTYIQANIPYEDANDDLAGGRLYFTLSGDGEELLQASRDCVTENPNANTDAILGNGIVTFGVGPVDTGVVHELEVYVNDFTVNTSNTITVPVTGS